MTNHSQCLNEFRDASAAVRLSFAALSEAREVQIIANRAHADASEAYVSAQSRLDAADAALIAVRAEAPAAADIDTTRMPATFGTPFNQMFANGAVTEQAD
jgi:hypothetical protein